MALQPPDVRAFQASLPPLEADWSERANKRAVLEADARNRDAMARANAAEAQERERALANANAMQRIWQESGGDWDVMIEKASALDPAEGAKLAEQRGKAQKANADAFTASMDAEQKRMERARMFLEVSLNDPEWYDGSVGSIAALLPEELRPALPATHNPERIKFLIAATADAKARAERAVKINDDILSGNRLKGVLNALAEQGDTEEEFNGVIQHYAPYLSKGEIALLPKWSPTAQADAARLAMTPSEKADNDRQAEAARVAGAKDVRDFTALERHRRATEAAGGGDNGPLQAIVGPDGKPVLVARRDAIGKQPAPSGAGATGKVPAGIALQVAGVEQSLAVLDKMEQNLPTSMMGPIAGRWTKFSADAPGVPVPAPVAKYLAEEATLRNAVIKATTGAAMSEPEAKRIMEQIPDITNKPERWKANAQATRENLGILRQRMLELSGVSGDMPTSQAPPTGAATHRWNPQTRKTERVP